MLVRVYFPDGSGGNFKLPERDLKLGYTCFNWFWKIVEMSEDKKEIWLENTNENDR